MVVFLMNLTWRLSNPSNAKSIIPATIEPVSRGMMGSPVNLLMKQWAALRIVRSSRMVPPHFFLKLVYCTKKYLNFLSYLCTNLRQWLVCSIWFQNVSNWTLDFWIFFGLSIKPTSRDFILQTTIACSGTARTWPILDILWDLAQSY